MFWQPWMCPLLLRIDQSESSNNVIFKPIQRKAGETILRLFIVWPYAFAGWIETG